MKQNWGGRGQEEVQMERQERERNEESKSEEKGTLSDAGLLRKDRADRRRRERGAADSLRGLAAVIRGTVNMSTLVQSLGLSTQLEACNIVGMGHTRSD